MDNEQNIFALGTEGLELIEIKSAEIPEDNRLLLKTIITTNEKDLVNDIVTQDCMDDIINQLKERTIKLDFEHEAFRGKDKLEKAINITRVPLGKRDSFERLENGIAVTWELNQDWKKFDERGNVVYTFDEVKRNIQNGYYDGTSIAYIPTDAIDGEKDGEPVRLLNLIRLLNVALTGNPINKGTTAEILMKSLDSLKSHSSNLDDANLKDGEQLNNAGNTMTEDQKKQLEADCKSLEEKRDALNAEIKSLEDKKSAELKSMESAELKSFGEQLKSVQEEVKSLQELKDEVAELKSAFSEGQMKGKGAQLKDQGNTPSAPVGLF